MTIESDIIETEITRRIGTRIHSLQTKVENQRRRIQELQIALKKKTYLIERLRERSE